MSRSESAPKRGGRAAGAEGYNRADVDALLACIKLVLPAGANDWEKVLALCRERHAKRLNRATRDMTSIKSKFHQLINYKKNTGNPDCPAEAKEAHNIQRMVRNRIHFQVVDDRDRDAPVAIDTGAECAECPSVGSGERPRADSTEHPGMDSAELSSYESDMSDLDAAVVNVFVNTSFEYTNERESALRPSSMATQPSCHPSIRVGVNRLRAPRTTEPADPKRQLTTRTPLSEWQQSVDSQRHDKSIQQFLSARVSALEHEKLSLKSELLSLCDNLRQANKTMDKAKDKNFQVHEDTLKYQEQIITLRTEIAALRNGNHAESGTAL